MEKLYSTRRAGEKIGGLHRNAVLILIRQGKLRCVTQPIRSAHPKKPRKYIPGSEIDRYINELKKQAEIDHLAAQSVRPKGKVSRAKTGIKRELEEAKCYF